MSDTSSPAGLPLPAPLAHSEAGARGRLKRLADALAQQPHLLAVRDGVVGALPLILVGSLFLLVAQPPIPWQALQDFVRPHVATLLLPYRMLGGLISVYVCFGAAHSLSKHYRLDPLAGGLLASACFFIAVGPSALAPAEGAARPGWGLAGERLGAGGLFAALAFALGVVELNRLFHRKRWTLRLPAGVPEPVGRSFEALVPGLAAIVLTFLLIDVAHVDAVGLIARATRPLLHAGDSLATVLAVVLVDSGFWALGVHPAGALATVRPVWDAMLIENMNAAAAGLAPPHIAPRELFLWFVWQGGSGGTLAVALLLLRARSATLKGIGKAALVPSLFNINEPILFGIPLVLNPALALPFVLAPLASALVAHTALSLGWVTPPHLEMVWTLPAPLGAFLSTGDPRAVVLQMANLSLSAAIYWPFLRRYDQSLSQKEKEAPAQTTV